MAFDGIAIKALVKEFREKLLGGHIQRIAQTEKDELLITVKNNRKNYRLLLSANASLPLAVLSEENKMAPETAPNFCMLLRKHLNGGKLENITQPGLERVIHFEISHLNEMGDVGKKILIAEFMGKHSNLIFCDEGLTVIDSIKHISSLVSSVREVLPGRKYFLPATSEKADPLTASEGRIEEALAGSRFPADKALYTSFTGISPQAAREIVLLSGVDADMPSGDLPELELKHLSHLFASEMEEIKEGIFTPSILYQDQDACEFSARPIHSVPEGAQVKTFSSMSEVLTAYYGERNRQTRIRQKSADLRHVVQTALERDYKKLDLQEKQLKDTEKRDKYRVYGELINTYGYELSGGEKELCCVNYYDGKEIRIPLDENLSAQENAVRYFERYNKLKRTAEALERLTGETRAEILHLESIATSLDIALREEDLAQIRQELSEFGFIKKHGAPGKKARVVSRPFHYRSSDGFDIYVGKNNYQNEEVTFSLASGNDWWFHAKGIPGSHVIVKSRGTELPDRVFEEAASLAAYYSKGRGSQKVEIDYIQKKQVKKVAGAAPGFVIYHTNYSMMASPRISCEEVTD